MIQKMLLIFLCTMFNSVSVHALDDQLMYIADGGGTLGTLDVTTGEINIIGEMGIEPIGISFDPDGLLYAVGTTDLYRIDSMTANATRVGSHGLNGGINAIAFGGDGTLYAVSYVSTSLWSLDVSTGRATTVGNIGFGSDGGLAFLDGRFFLSGRQDILVELDLSRGGAGTVIGPFGGHGVHELAGSKGVLYGAWGTTIYTVDLVTGWATEHLEWQRGVLGPAAGIDFKMESIPAPSVSALLILCGLLSRRSRRRESGDHLIRGLF